MGKVGATEVRRLTCLYSEFRAVVTSYVATDLEYSVPKTPQKDRNNKHCNHIHIISDWNISVLADAKCNRVLYDIDNSATRVL